MQRARFAALLPPIIEWLSALGIATVFGLGCWQVITGQLSIGWFIGYIAMVGLMFKPIKTIGNVNSALQQCLASAERIFYLLDFGPETQDKNPPYKLAMEKMENGIKLQNVRGAVTFENVSFSYRQSSTAESVIKNITFEAGTRRSCRACRAEWQWQNNASQSPLTFL